MSDFNESYGLKFIWRIDNFNYLKNETVTSPVFGSEVVTWKIQISFTDGIHFSVKNSTIFHSNFNCSIAFLDSDCRPLVWLERHIFETKRTLHDIPFEFPNENKKFLSSILTIECRIWRNQTGLLKPSISLYARSLVEPVPKIIKKNLLFCLNVCNINESHWSLEEKVTIDISESSKMEVCLNAGENIQASITTYGLYKNSVKVQVVVLTNFGQNIEFSKVVNDICFENYIWYLDTNIRKSMLLCYPHIFFSANKLKLLLNFTFSIRVSSHNMVTESDFLATYLKTTASIVSQVTSVEPENVSFKTNTKSSCTISEAVQDIFSEGYRSDFNLKVDEKVFPVHKAILGMRSNVFKAMFDSDMKEMRDNCMVVKDMDSDTLQRMLQFIYSDRIDKDMQWSEASSLYAAANFYDLEPLKEGCSNILKEILNNENVLGVLTMADLHQDQQLKSAALDFILFNDQDLVGTKDWIAFEKENVNLALETLRELYLRKSSN